ncbi:MAG: hypothetical protein RBG13Loki_0246 [Promethearchaeota archaeon CR_4]|nr:MAG: hypothetical protein RBG13Loki_0246 [Candidatus Lokiarchaeota archaeon CR_4]
MCFSNNGTTYTAWESYALSKTWTFAGGAGNKTVYFKTRNTLGEAGPVTDSITYKTGGIGDLFGEDAWWIWLIIVAAGAGVAVVAFVLYKKKRGY